MSGLGVLSEFLCFSCGLAGGTRVSLCPELASLACSSQAGLPSPVRLLGGPAVLFGGYVRQVLPRVFIFLGFLSEC